MLVRLGNIEADLHQCINKTNLFAILTRITLMIYLDTTENFQISIQRYKHLSALKKIALNIVN